MNLYAYVGNDPVNKIDNVGLRSCWRLASGDGVWCDDGEYFPTSREPGGRISYQDYCRGTCHGNDYSGKRYTSDLENERLAIAADILTSLVPGTAAFRSAKWVARGGSRTAKLGKKLDFVFGRSGGRNAARSQAVQRQLASIGIYENKAGRRILKDHLRDVQRSQRNIKEIQDDGRIVRESLLSGSGGIVKVESIWEKNKLITVKIFGGR